MEATAKKATFQKYPAYKDSGVEWLAEIPEHWQAIKMKYLFRDVSEKNKPEAELLSVTQDKGVVPRTWVESRMVMPSGNLESFKFIQKGDFAISLRSFEGGLEYCHHDGIISPAYTVLKKKKGLIDGYYKYLFKSKSFISEIQTSVVGIREGKNISYFELSYSLLPIPSPEEQTAIAAFLDDKTAKIERAIAQKEKMIALLKERKQIIIQNAVTKGLDPNAKMKHSGVEWIGEIPEGWEVKRLKVIVKSRTGFAFPSDRFVNEGIPLVRIGDLDSSGVVILDSCAKLPYDYSKYLMLYGLKENDLLFAMTGGTIGKIAVYKGCANALLNQRVCSFTINDTITRSIVLFWMSTKYWKDYIDLNSIGGAQPNISDKVVLNIRIALSKNKAEQCFIISHIETQSAKIDKAIKLQEQQIEKLKELKSTLIDSAVTGKIKVS